MLRCWRARISIGARASKDRAFGARFDAPSARLEGVATFPGSGLQSSLLRLWPKADLSSRSLDVRFGGKADVGAKFSRLPYWWRLPSRPDWRLNRDANARCSHVHFSFF